MRRIFQGVVVLLATLPRLAMGADLTSYTSKEGKDIIILRGDIAPADSERLRALILAANQGGRMVSGIRLTSNGGNLIEGVKLADVILYSDNCDCCSKRFSVRICVFHRLRCRARKIRQLSG